MDGVYPTSRQAACIGPQQKTSWISYIFLQKKSTFDIQAVLLLSALCLHVLADFHCYHCGEESCSSIISPVATTPTIPTSFFSSLLYRLGAINTTLHIKHGWSLFLKVKTGAVQSAWVKAFKNTARLKSWSRSRMSSPQQMSPIATQGVAMFCRLMWSSTEQYADMLCILISVMN